jgi:MFS family permease
MSAVQKILRYARLNAAEEQNFKLLFVQTLFFGFATSFYLAVVSGYFITHASISALPLGYVLSGLAGFLLTGAYKRTLRNKGASAAYSVVLWSFLVLSVLLFVCRSVVPDTSKAAVYVAYLGFIGISPYFAIIFLGFAKVTLKIYDLSQSKRLLALVGSGEVFASFVAYLCVPFLTRILGGAAPLLLFSAAFSLLAIFSLRRITNGNADKLVISDEDRSVRHMKWSLFAKNEFYMLFAIVATLSVFAVYFVDFSYLLSVRYIADDKHMEAAGVVAVVFSIIKLGELVFSLLSRKIMSSQGMRFALLSQPLVLLALSAFAVLFGSLFIEVPYFVVAFLLFNKWAIRVISKAFTAPAMKVMYLVTDLEDRAQLQTNIDGTLNQYGTIASGILLFIVSAFFGKMDVILFLKIVAAVCVVAFALWTWFTVKLFANYKVEIKEYLDHLLSNKSQFLEGETAGEAETVEHIDVHPLLEQVKGQNTDFSKSAIARYITYYNPAIKNLIDEDALSHSMLKRAYYHNENFFSRLLIIWYMKNQSHKARLSFAKEFYGISDIQLKIEILKLLTGHNFVVDPSDSYYFTSLCEEAIKEIIWAEATIYDLVGQVDVMLTEALSDHIVIQHDLLFELLKILYDKESISAAQEVINSSDNSFENKVFAVELLDNILDSNMKKLIIPLFEDISYPAKKEKLQKVILVYNLPVAQRLKEILMMNFLTVSPYIKQLALEEYYRLTHDKNTVAACASSYLENLSSTAATILANTERSTFTNKLKAIDAMRLKGTLSDTALASFLKWGIAAKSKGRREAKVSYKNAFQNNEAHIAPLAVSDENLALDMLGLSIMLRLQQ